MGFWQWFLSVAAGITVVVAAFSAVAKAVKWLNSLISEIREFLRDWHGEEARPDIGYAGRKGMMARIYEVERQNAAQLEEIEQLRQQVSKVHHEVVPNGGGSLRDSVNRIERSLEEVR